MLSVSSRLVSGQSCINSLTGSLGAVISPLQSIFTTISTVQTPGNLGQVRELTDLLDFFHCTRDGSDQTSAAILRASMTSTSITDPHSRLWTPSGSLNCTIASVSGDNTCTLGQVSFNNISALEDPFVAQLPAGFSTGLVRQFLPRLNSSIAREKISESAFPSNCSYDSTFFANYSTSVLTSWDNGTQSRPSWHLMACNPGAQSSRPLKPPRQRHDFSEELYLNLSAWDPPNSESQPPSQWSGLYKITLDTTSGYFELPNYMNNKRPGPLLTGDPSDSCGQDCITQRIPSYEFIK